MILSPGLRKLVLTADLTCSVGWIGAVVAYLALGVFAAAARDAEAVRSAWVAMEVAGWWAIVPLAPAALLTGLVMALGTPWGLFRHYWVLISLALTLLCIAVLLGPLAAAVEDVGSTAVPGLAAKPVLDILVGAAPFPLPDDALAALAALGYEYRGDNGVPGRQFFRTNPRTRHLHVVEFGGEEWLRLTLFRDYCRAHAEVAQQYEALKRRLATDHPHERRRYTEGKAAFIEAVLRRAPANAHRRRKQDREAG